MEFKSIISEGLRIELPVIGLGTWQMGGRNEADNSRDNFFVNSIRSAIHSGYTLIDTAESYGAGHTEELIGMAINNLQRDKLFIISKVSSNNLDYDSVISSAKNSLNRLKIKYFDLYLIHFPNPEISIQETMRAMDYLVENNMTRFIGVSNFSVNELIEAQTCSKNKIVANQIQYSLTARNKCTYGNCINMESEIIPYCQQNDVLIIADRPFDKGALLNSSNNAVDDLLFLLSKKYNKTKSQIALNWLIHKKNIVTIPMSTNPVHQKENLGAVGWTLDAEDVVLLDNLKLDDK